MNAIKFNSVKEFVNWLIDHEGFVIADEYGREWKYVNYCFYFKDIGKKDDPFQDTLQCVHLFRTSLYWLTP
jgi:hypothetical protein